MQSLMLPEINHNKMLLIMSNGQNVLKVMALNIFNQRLNTIIKVIFPVVVKGKPFLFQVWYCTWCSLSYSV